MDETTPTTADGAGEPDPDRDDTAEPADETPADDAVGTADDEWMPV